MKRIDQWAGGFGCLALDVVDLFIGRLRSRRLDPERVRVVLVTKYLGLGSILLAAPMVERLRRLFPQARIVFLTFAENREVATMLGIFDEILTIDSRRLSRLGRDSAAALGRLWRLHVDVVCDLEFFTRYSTMIAYLSGARVRVGYFSRIAWRGNLITHPVYYNGMKHITRVFLAQAEVLGARIDEDAPVRLPALGPDREAARDWHAALSERGIRPHHAVLAVNPNASELCLERRWMPERFAHVVDALLSDDPDLLAVFIGSPSESAFTQSVIDRCRLKERTVNLAGVLGLRALAEALREARLFLTNDSGPLHLATLTGTPTIALFGPETPTLYGPVGANQRAFYAGVYCSPCLNVYNAKTATCHGNNICLQAFSVDVVLEACRAALAKGAPRAVAAGPENAASTQSVAAS